MRPTANTTVTIGDGSFIDIDLSPALVRSLTLGAGDFTVNLWLHADAGNAGSRSVNAQLRYTGASSGVIDDFSQSVALPDSLAGVGTRVPFTLNVAADLTLLAGTQFQLRVTNQSATGGDDLVLNSFKSGDANPYSEISLNSNTVIDSSHSITLKSIKCGGPPAKGSYTNKLLPSSL